MLAAQLCIHQQRTHPDDGIKRRADFVAHRCKQGALRGRGIFGSAARRFNLRRALGHFLLKRACPFQIFQRHGCLVGQDARQVQVFPLKSPKTTCQVAIDGAKDLALAQQGNRQHAALISKIRIGVDHTHKAAAQPFRLGQPRLNLGQKGRPLLIGGACTRAGPTVDRRMWRQRQSHLHRAIWLSHAA